MTEKTFSIAVKQYGQQSVPENWKERLAQIDGVTSVTGNLPHRAQFTATDQGIDSVKGEFGSAFYIEPLAGRTLP